MILRKRRAVLLLAVALMMVAAACGDDATEATAAPTPEPTPEPTPAPTPEPEPGPVGQGMVNPADVTIIYVGCGAPTGFAGIVNDGAETAARHLGITYQYAFPDQVTAAGLATTLEAAIAARPTGIALCGLDPGAHASLVAEGVDAGILFALSPSDEPYSENPLRSATDLYVGRAGSDEFSAGVTSGTQVLLAGVASGKVAVMINPQDSTQFLRADGVKSVVEPAGLDWEIVEMTGDPGQNAELATSYLRANTDVTAIVVTNLEAFEGADAAIKELGLDVVFGAFDLFGPVVAAIQDGRVSWTIDQQPWWRGYVPVWDLGMMAIYGLVRANWFLTGPAVVDSSNIEATLVGVQGGWR